MYIYNITFHIEDKIHDEALSFLKNEYIPLAGKGGLLMEPRLCRIRTAHGESGSSYSIQFYVKNEKNLSDWVETIGEELHKQINIRFTNQVLGFTTLLEELDY